MSQPLHNESGRTPAIDLNFGADGGKPSDGWPWFWIGQGLTVLTCFIALFVAANGTPYLQLGSTVCYQSALGDHPCDPPIRCPYSGLQGQRDMTFPDTDRCPFLTFLPWRLEPATSRPAVGLSLSDRMTLPPFFKADRRLRKPLMKKTAAPRNGKRPAPMTAVRKQHAGARNGHMPAGNSPSRQASEAKLHRMQIRPHR